MADSLDLGVRVGTDLRDFGSWMTSEQRRIFLLCRRMLQDPSEADSATQDVFLKAYNALKKGGLDDLDHPGKWITRIAVNTCLDRLRSKTWKIWQRRPEAAQEQIILNMTAEAGPDAETQLFAKQIQSRLEKALEKLSGRQRAVFTLRHFDGLQMDEIAEALDLDVGTVKAHMFRALGKLRTELQDIYTARSGGNRQAGS
jgi:RNA polymerase sigma-70 factor (ECF subfamily)